MPKALVTGGGGFLGGAIARRLLAGGWQVKSLSRGSYPALAAAGAECVQGDVADGAAVAKACDGMDVVFHVAAKVGLWGKPEDFERANVHGTSQVLSGCLKAGVRRLVFTGSPSVVFDGRDVEGADERMYYSTDFDSHYSRTKALSEAMVLKADGPALSTVSLRPHLVWGPGENHIVSHITAQGRAGKLRRILGFDKKVDTTYIDDCVDAHLLAAEKLSPGSRLCGKAYFISSGDPRPLWWIIDGILNAAGLPPVKRSVPRPVALAAATVFEGVHRALGLDSEPRLTRFMVHQLSTAHWFDISAARRDLGYAPKISLEEGLRRLKTWFQDCRSVR